MVLKRDLTPLTKRGRIDKHKGKGGTPPASLPAARGGFPKSINDYAKATPMANPAPGGGMVVDSDQDMM